jgi:ribosomal protein L29
MFSIQELRSSTKKELLLELAKSRKENMKIRISLKTKHEKDSSKSIKIKRYIAQILTILKQIYTEEKDKDKGEELTVAPKSEAKPKKVKGKSK